MNELITLVINGLSTGMLIFLLAAGLTLIFGLMDVLNFAHGSLFAWGAYFGVWVYTMTSNFLIGIIGALVIGLLFGYILERFIVQPVYGNHIQQILVTLGAMIVLSEGLKVIWGPNPIGVSVPASLDGSWEIGGVIFIKYRLFIIFMGLLVFVGLLLLLNRTKLGLVVRAGVINKEMVQALGINIKKTFATVFMLGSAMAALGGILLSPYSGVITSEMGMEFAIFAFIVVVIGGKGNIIGTVLASILVGLTGAFMAYYYPSLSMFVNMLLMLAVLLFRPSGLLGVKR